MYKFLCWVSTLLIALAVWAEEKKWNNPLALIPVTYEETKSGPVLKKPITLSASDWLWQLLNETKIENNLEENTLDIYANTIRNLCSLNPSLLKKDEYHKLSPQDFSLTYCAPTIDAVFADFMSVSDSKEVIGEYQETLDASECKRDYVHISDTARQISDRFMKYAPQDFFTDDEFDNTTVTFDTEPGTDGNKNYAWSCTFKNSADGKRKLKLGVYENDLRIAYLHAIIESPKWETKIDIKWHRIIPEKRYQGIGTTLLETAINLFTYFKNFTKVTMIATPEKMSQAPALVSYYKRHGFLPSRRGYHYLMLYISKKGHIIKPVTAASHRMVRRLIKGDDALKIVIPPLKVSKKTIVGTPVPNEKIEGKYLTAQHRSLLPDIIASGQYIDYKFFTPQSPQYKKKEWINEWAIATQEKVESEKILQVISQLKKKKLSNELFKSRSLTPIDQSPNQVNNKNSLSKSLYN